MIFQGTTCFTHKKIIVLCRCIFTITTTNKKKEKKEKTRIQLVKANIGGVICILQACARGNFKKEVDNFVATCH